MAQTASRETMRKVPMRKDDKKIKRKGFGAPQPLASYDTSTKFLKKNGKKK